MRATKDRLLDLLFGATQTTTAGDDDNSCFYGNDAMDDPTETEFISDFLLTFRLFWTQRPPSSATTTTTTDTCVAELMEHVIADMQRSGAGAEKHVKIVLLWIGQHFQDFSKALLSSFESHLKSKIHKKLFYFTLSTKSR